MKNKLYRILLILLVMVGLLLIFNKQIAYFFMQKTGENYQISKVDKAKLAENDKKTGEFDFAKVEPASSQAVASSLLDVSDLPVTGGIAVPAVGIQLPIFKGLSNENLLYGAGTLSPTQKMGKGNYALASHRMTDPKLLFTPLERVNKGDKIYLTDKNKIYVYQTTFKKRLQPTASYVLDEPEKTPLVTLITCGEMEGVTRVVVQGELLETLNMDQNKVFK